MAILMGPVLIVIVPLLCPIMGKVVKVLDPRELFLVMVTLSGALVVVVGMVIVVAVSVVGLILIGLINHKQCKLIIIDPMLDHSSTTTITLINKTKPTGIPGLRIISTPTRAEVGELTMPSRNQTPIIFIGNCKERKGSLIGIITTILIL